MIKQEVPSILYNYVWSGSVALSIFYGVIFLINAIGIKFLALIRGQGLVQLGVDIVIFGREVDLLILVASLSFLLVTYTLYRDKISGASLFLVLPICLFPLAAVEIGSLATWVSAGFMHNNPFADSSWNVALLEMRFANILYPWAPRIMLIFLFSGLFGFLFRYYKQPLSQMFSKISRREPSTDGERVSNIMETHSRVPILYLTIGLIMAIFIAVYPYLPAVGSDGRLIGVDTEYYLKKLELAQGSSISTALMIAVTDDRTVLHLFNYFLSFLVNDPVLVMKLLPLILSALLVLSTFLLVRVGTDNSHLAGLSALFTPVAFQQIAGMNAGFYANWLALIEINVFFSLLLVSLRKKRFKLFYGITALSILVLFTHPWSWFVLMGSVSIFMVAGFLTKSSGKMESFSLLGLLAINILADTVKGAAIPWVGTGSQAVYASLIPSLRLSDLSSVFGVLGETFTTFLGGAFNNLPLIVLAAIGFASIRTYGDRFHAMLLAQGVSGLGGVFLLSANFLSYLQARALYVIPFQIFGALGFVAVTHFVRGISFRARVPDSYMGAFNVLLALWITTSMMNHTLRMASSLYPFLS